VGYRVAIAAARSALPAIGLDKRVPPSCNRNMSVAPTPTSAPRTTRPLHVVDPARCRGDGACAEVCSKMVLEVHAGRARTVADRADRCMACGQCVAVCPNQALSLTGLGPECFEPVRRGTVDYQALLAFLRSRRSVRTFKNRPVDRSALDTIAEAAGSAPMGFEHTTELLILDRRDLVVELVADVRRAYDKLLGIYDRRIGRLILRAMRGAETLHALDTHVIRIVRDNNEQHRTRGLDRYSYGAPAIILFHANRWSVAYQENALIVATYAMLAAHALGLGTTMLSIVPPALNNFPAIRRRWGLGDDQRVLLALTVGHPRYKYRRAVVRQLGAVRYASAPAD
jgi:NAD-dependent dihydropyrimidine dehydrogenase PreA subunit/nitroreductase